MENTFAFIEKSDDSINLALIEDGKLTKYKNYGGPEGNIYRALVEKYIKPLKAYVVNLGLEKKGLLKASIADSDLKPNDHVIVELIKESKDHKLHDVTGLFTLTDGFIVLKKVKDKDEYKVLMRTAGKKLSEDEKLNKEKRLKVKFEDLYRQRKLLPSPKLLIENRRLQNFIDAADFPVYSPIEITAIEGVKIDPTYTKEFNLLIYKSLQEVTGKRIKTDSGVEMVFDQTEALAVVDINAASFKLDHSKEMHSFLANRSCLDELARMIAIKNIKKMLIIDFIRMNEKHSKIIDQEFRESLKKYGVKTQIFSFTKMGLYEIIVK